MLAALKSRFDRRGERAVGDEVPAGLEDSRASREPPDEADDEPFVVRVADRGEICFDQKFPAGAILIGGNPECDIVITDLEEPEIATLRLENIGAACLVTLTALAPGVVARGRELPVGQPLVFPERASFFVGDEYGFEAFYEPARTPIAAPGAMPVLLICGAVLLAAAAWIIGQPTPRPPLPEEGSAVERQIGPPVESIDDAAIRRPAINDVASPAARLALAEAELRARLVSANLIPPLRVGGRVDTLVVTGAVTTEERERIVDVLSDFRERVDIPLEMSLESEPRAAPFFTAIVLEPEALVIGADGRRYRVDQRLPDGGVLEKIDEKSIIVNRDGLRERIDYAR